MHKSNLFIEVRKVAPFKFTRFIDIVNGFALRLLFYNLTRLLSHFSNSLFIFIFFFLFVLFIFLPFLVEIFVVKVNPKNILCFLQSSGIENNVSLSNLKRCNNDNHTRQYR